MVAVLSADASLERSLLHARISGLHMLSSEIMVLLLWRVDLCNVFSDIGTGTRAKSAAIQKLKDWLFEANFRDTFPELYTKSAVAGYSPQAPIMWTQLELLLLCAADFFGVPLVGACDSMVTAFARVPSDSPPDSPSDPLAMGADVLGIELFTAILDLALHLLHFFLNLWIIVRCITKAMLHCSAQVPPISLFADVLVHYSFFTIFELPVVLPLWSPSRDISLIGHS
ncbi:hypothetical protein BU15DRAFT_69442 [Melanogaster broomeanus]|nr:hypothetical protein BU15DRAFT_69442 [Melanogaster broomeanus]